MALTTSPAIVPSHAGGASRKGRASLFAIIIGSAATRDARSGAMGAKVSAEGATRDSISSLRGEIEGNLRPW